MDWQPTMTKILCLDNEGGHGGSSRSLHFILEAMDLSDLSVTVWCKRKSWLVEEYKKKGIDCLVYPRMPKFTAVEKLHGNLIEFFRFVVIQLPLSFWFLRQLISQCSKTEIVHINHISLLPLAFMIRMANKRIRIVTHIRTMPPPSFFARVQAKLCNHISDEYIFITENEREHFQLLCNRQVQGQIIHNPVKQRKVTHLKKTAERKRHINILSLSNFSFQRGVDRLIEVAKCLPQEERHNFSFILAGNIPLQTKRIFPSKGINFRDEIKKAQVEDLFSFPGHVSSPERLIENSDVLLKLTRENNPWGRDILEALGAGLPVVSVGSYDKFVRTNQTGLLLENFNPQTVADWLVHLLHSPAEMEKLAYKAIDTIERYNSPVIAARLLKYSWIQK